MTGDIGSGSCVRLADVGMLYPTSNLKAPFVSLLAGWMGVITHHLIENNKITSNIEKQDYK
jgi:hypothetical protein